MKNNKGKDAGGTVFLGLLGTSWKLDEFTILENDKRKKETMNHSGFYVYSYKKYIFHRELTLIYGHVAFWKAYESYPQIISFNLTNFKQRGMRMTLTHIFARINYILITF